MKKQRKIKVSGKPHPEGMAWEFNLVVDYTGCTIEDILDDCFAHNVVQLQNGTLRPSTAKELDAIQETGEYRVAYKDIKKGRQPIDRAKVVREFLINQAGMTPEQAQAVINDPTKLAKVTEMLNAL